MSRQIAVLAPATRVMSRKLGPVAGSRSPSSESARAACATSTLASTCGRCETVASMRSWVSASSAAGARRGRSSSRCRRSYSVPRVPAVGVRYQVAPSNSSARAWRTPAFSAPASGCPPMKRSSSHRLHDGALGRADVGHHAVLAGRRERGADRRRERADRRGDEGGLGAVERGARVRRRAVDRAALRARRRARPRPGRSPATSAPSRSRAARPIEPPIRPTPTIAIFTRR